METTSVAADLTVNASAQRATQARCLVYALFSQLTASPSETHPSDRWSSVNHWTDLMMKLGAELPYHVDFSELGRAARGLTDAEAEQLADEYAALFEIGSDGPPVPIREGLAEQHPWPAREEVARFYDFFGYTLQQPYQWQFDHLAVQLEFVHYLIYHEEHSEDVEEARSYQLAQCDFVLRHILSWYGQLHDGVMQHATSDYYKSLFAVLGHFLREDLAWQQARLHGGTHR
ncbi:MAG: molecular chaperone TorD family protein [Acidobacteriota bacterium]|nr:molecular chaperone TorD family protein [Blastocatellia bacterium]MDW8238231.1 molecular chaperone TorD family protein [Acidobacteriota bacterium]